MPHVYSRLSPWEQTLFCCLALQHRLGYAGFARLLEIFGTPGEVYRASEIDLSAAYPKLPLGSVLSVRKGPDPENWARVAARCAGIGARIAPQGTPWYPATLLALPNPPPLLFVQGEWVSADARAVAMVGTRVPTDYGRRAARILARDLARSGVTVVSGLAIGIDAESHAGALEGGGRTLAVIGCGHDVDYPRENRVIRERIATNGAVISEFPPGEQPQRVHFPRRNRILSALAQATVVVEAGIKSGALITAAYARTQGKALFAVPGPIFSPASMGANALLRRGIPAAVSAEDILAGLETGGHESLPVEKSEEGEDPMLQLWRGEETCSLDNLGERARNAGISPPGGGMGALLSSLLRLELRGLVERLPGPAFRNRCRVRLSR